MKQQFAYDKQHESLCILRKQTGCIAIKYNIKKYVEFFYFYFHANVLLLLHFKSNQTAHCMKLTIPMFLANFSSKQLLNFGGTEHGIDVNFGTSLVGKHVLIKVEYDNAHVIGVR